MASVVQGSGPTHRFGPFEYRIGANRLHKYGQPIRVERKPLLVLSALLERPGQVVAREELQRRLWSEDTFVDFELGLRVAVNKLREALGDEADEPRYIETVVGEGYRFVAAVETVPIAEFVPSQEAAAGQAATAADQRPLALEGGSKRPIAGPGWLLGRWPWLAAALVVLAGAGLLWKPAAPPPPAQRPGWVLITAVENRSGNPVLDGTLEYALERELSNSRFVKVVPEQRIQDALRLLRKPPDAKLDAALGREVCLRDGDIQALLTGRVEKLGSTYVLSVQVMDPARGVTLASFSEQDRADTELAAAVRRLSIRVRESLGEEPQQIQESMTRLEKVTTPSLAALQLYSKADRLLVRSEGQWNDKSAEEMRAEAAGLLRQALAAEPDFAAAHLLLAQVLVNADGRQEAAPHFRRAFELAGTVSERERLFILARSHQFNGDWERARQSYESLLALYPDDYWAVHNLIGIYLKEQKIGHITEMMTHRADLRPRDFASNVAAFDWLSTHQQREARVYYHRALALVTPEVERDQPMPVVELETFPFYEAWDRRDPGAAAKQADGLKNKAESRTGDLRQATIYSLVEELFVLGRLHELERWAALMSDPGERALAQATLAEERQDVRAVRSAVLEQLRLKTSVGPNTVARLARAGLVPQAQAALPGIISGRPYPADADFAAGEIALAQGRLPEAVARLSSAVEGFREHNMHYRSLATVALAKALERQGKAEEASRVLAREVESDPSFGSNDALLRLARLYRAQGRAKEAEQLEERVRQSLAYADPDHPLRMLLSAQAEAPATRAAVR